MDIFSNEVEERIADEGMQFFMNDSLKFFGINEDVMKIKRIRKKGHVKGITRSSFKNFVFLLDDDTYAHFHLVSDKPETEYMNYKWLNDELRKEGKRIRGHIIVPSGLNIFVDNESDIDVVDNQVEIHRFNELDGDAAIREIEKGIKGRKTLSKREMMIIVFSTILPGENERMIRLKKAIEVADNIPCYDESITTLALLYIFAPTYISGIKKEIKKNLFMKTKLIDWVKDTGEKSGD